MKRSMLWLVSVSLVISCSQSEPPRESLAGPAGVIPDEKSIEIGRAVPGFGGMYLDDDGVLNVYMVEGAKSLSPVALEARKAQLERALRQILGDDFLLQARVQRSDPARAEKAAPKINVVKGDYDILQLASWRSKVDSVLAVPGVV